MIVTRQIAADPLIVGCKLETATLGELTDVGTVKLLPWGLMLGDVWLPGLSARLPFIIGYHGIKLAVGDVQPDRVAGFQ